MKISNLEIILIRAYQKTSKPVYFLLDSFGLNFFKCRYEPSCSHYAEDAILKYGTIKGTRMAVVRILRCRPGYEGYDPVK